MRPAYRLSLRLCVSGFLLPDFNLLAQSSLRLIPLGLTPLQLFIPVLPGRLHLARFPDRFPLPFSCNRGFTGSLVQLFKTPCRLLAFSLQQSVSFLQLFTLLQKLIILRDQVLVPATQGRQLLTGFRRLFPLCYTFQLSFCTQGSFSVQLLHHAIRLTA
ncbi:hypothetical protein D3C81_1710560 [compost metagenome]